MADAKGDSKVAAMPALGRPGIARQFGSGPERKPLPSSRHETGNVERMALEIEHLTAEVARLKRELASRPPLPSGNAATQGNASDGNAGNEGNARLTPAEKQRRYRERKKAQSVVKLDELVNSTVRAFAEREARRMVARNPLFECLDRHVREVERDKWLSGAPDVSMGISWTQEWPSWRMSS